MFRNTGKNDADDALRTELAKLAEAREHVLQDWKAARDAANKQWYVESRAADTAADLWTRVGPGIEDLRAKAQVKATEACQAMRAALVAADDRLAAYGVVCDRIAEVEGELDRRQRGWTPPQPIAVPSLPDERLLPSERVEVVMVLVPQLAVRRQRASERLSEAERWRNASRVFDHTLSAGVFRARHQDAEADYRQRLADFEAINGRLLSAQGELRRLELVVA
jgi:hypothetical protein